MKNILHLQKGLFALSFSCFLLISCDTKSNQRKLKINSTESKGEKLDLANFISKFNIPKYTKKLAILSDNGCLNCNRKMVLFLEKIKDDSNVTILIEASGLRFDISELSDSISPRIIFLQKNEASIFFGTEESSIIQIEDFEKSKYTIFPVNIETVDKLNTLF